MRACALLLALSSCGDEEGAAGGADLGAPDAGARCADGGFCPDRLCPGDPDCPDEGDGVLRAGFAARDVTPQPVGSGAPPGTPTFEAMFDADADGFFTSQIGDDPDCPWVASRECDPDCTGDPGAVCPDDGAKPEADCFYDDDDDGCFDAIWLSRGAAGDGRAAQGIRDPVWARCAVLAWNATRVAICAVDALGYFYDPDVTRIREMMDPAWEIDLVLVGATHDHEAPDLLGLGGARINTSGVRPEHRWWVGAEIAAAVGEAVAALRPVTITYAAIDTMDEDGSVSAYVSDTRDPIVLTPRLHAFRFDDADGDTVGTLINWAAHPEYMGFEQPMISSDFVGYVRDGVEAEFGGTAVYVSGPLGGQIGPGDVCAPDPDDLCPAEHDADGRVCGHSYCKAELVGRRVAEFAVAAFDEGAVTEGEAPIAFRTKTTFAQIQNTFYHAAGQLGIFSRGMYHFDPDMPIDFNAQQTPLGEVATDANVPDVLTELAALRIGRAHIVAAPGELHPELFLGCYERDADGFGACSYDWPLADPDNVNPPDFSRAPPPPYLKDLLDEDADYKLVFGLTPDMLGYILPMWNFELGLLPYLTEADGDHYEETNSIGPTAETQVISTLRRLLCWREDGKSKTSEACATLAGWNWVPPWD